MSRFKHLIYLIKNKIITRYIITFYSISTDKGVLFKGIPHLIKNKKAHIRIGKNTIINSSNFGYHINMHSSCKLYADLPLSTITIGSNCRIHGTCIHASNQIHIGNNCLIAANTQIFDSNGHLLSFDNPTYRIHTKDQGNTIHIEDNVWIGANCIILGGTRIGNGAIITAGSVVKGNIPSKSIYGGNPAQLIKQY
ncbi:acyltransferase [Flavobacterium granuli]|uniref:Acetyltransferase-like isoleucine patch superfamily enzyme n=1 Tax=Flavobacterium granuli TaxID=280093 RepID=A0ABU1S510_9FLAO|nr:acyltransferase [Flavobacterium granuli]MDR6846141.1 acetyltransferase-like isoleucine patch superfamily enzyme [Flavobacterium granuli]